MTTVESLMTIISVAVVPLLVWILSKSGMSGDRKRVTIVVVAIVLGVLQGVATGAFGLPESVTEIVAKGIGVLAIVVGLSQAMYVMLKDKVDPSPVDKTDQLG